MKIEYLIELDSIRTFVFDFIYRHTCYILKFLINKLNQMNYLLVSKNDVGIPSDFEMTKDIKRRTPRLTYTSSKPVLRTTRF